MRQVLLVLVVLGAVVGVAAPKKKVIKPEPAPAASTPSTPLVVVAPVRLSDEYTELEPRAMELLRAELSKFDLDLLDEGDGGVKGQGVTVQLSVEAAREQMRGTLLVTKLPGGGLRGSWFVHASGPAPADLLEAVIPALIDETSTDLEWKKARDAGP